MRVSIGLVAVITSFTLVGCATPEEREVAVLERELGPRQCTLFPEVFE